MKGINISCNSQSSIAIIHSSMELKPRSSSSSASLPSSSSHPPTAPRLLDGGGSGGGGGRAIDRHNPIVTDGKRSSMITSTTTMPFSSPHPFASNLTICPTKKPVRAQHHHKGPPAQTKKPKKKKKNQQKSGITTSSTTTSAKKLIGLAKKAIDSSSMTTALNHHHHHHRHQYDQILQVVNKSISKPSDLMIVKGTTAALRGSCTVAKAGMDYISPPESSRHLLDNDAGDGYNKDMGFPEGLSRFDPVLKPVFGPSEAKKKAGADEAMTSSSCTSKPAGKSNSTAPSTSFASRSKPQPQPPSSTSTSTSSGSSSALQVVVLRVSLHCRGCEAKVRKHISRMQGVTSFSIDLASKKVTVVGDVTPLGVLASISKVKNAQLWTPPATSPSTTLAHDGVKKHVVGGRA